MLRKMADMVRTFWSSGAPSSAYGPAGLASHAGEDVGEVNALALASVWACVNLLTGTQASLPLHVYRGAGASRTLYPEHPLSDILRRTPNADQSAFEFWQMMLASLELRGNAYALRHANVRGALVALEPVTAPVLVTRSVQGGLRYQWSQGGRSFDRTAEDMLHIRGFSGGPLGGLSTLENARHVVGLSMATDKAAASTFRNGLRPSGVLQFKEFLSQENRNIARDKLAGEFAGAANSGKPLVLEGGADWKPLAISPEDAQMLQSRSFSVEEICRFFGVPPFMIGHTEKTTSWGTGIEQQTLGFVKFALTPRIRRVEGAIARQLLGPSDRAADTVVEYSLEGLLRGDSKARAEFYRVMIGIGAMTINEARAFENWSPVAGGDVARMQAQNIPITASAALPGADGQPAD